MEKPKNITIIFLLAVCLVPALVQAKSASVLLQEGLYAEEIEGDLDKAIQIYQQITTDNSVNQSTAAQAMYRLGMCHLKKQNEQQAKAVFEKLIAKFPQQTAIIKKVKPLLLEIGDSDPAALMPPNTLMYIEIGSPGKQIETILNILKGTPFANPLAVLGQSGGGQKSPGDVMATLFNPSMMQEFKKIRGMAIGLTELRSNNPPGVAVLNPGKSDALRGILLAAIGMATVPGEPIEGMQTLVTGNAGVAYDDNVIIIGLPLEQLKWSVKQYKGITNEPTLASQNKAFAKLGRQSRKDNALTIWLDGATTYAVISEQMSSSGQARELRLIDGIADLKSINDVMTYLSIKEKDIIVNANVNFKDGHNSLAYGLIRTPNLSTSAFAAVPSEAIAVAGLALGEPESALAGKAQQQVKNLTGLDIGREIFANIEQITIFALPPTPSTNKSILAREFNPILPCIGLAVTSHNPQRTRRLFDQLLTVFQLAATLNDQTGTVEGRYQIGLINNQPFYCYMDQMDNVTILAISPEVLQASLSAIKSRQSVLTSGPLHEPLSRLSPDTSKLVMVNVAGAIEVADATIHKSVEITADPDNYPLSKLLDQLAQNCDKTHIQFHTGESINNFNVRLSVNELPQFGKIFPLLMQLPMSMPENISTKAIKPRPADGVVVSPDPKPKLTWKPGISATSHKVYFGTSADQLSLVGEVTEADFNELPKLERDTNYYWRVDEVQADGSVITGDLWSFNTARIIGWWKFDEGSGTIAKDSSGNKNNARLIGARWAQGTVSFDGRNDYIEIDNDGALDAARYSEYSVAVWLKPNALRKRGNNFSEERIIGQTRKELSVFILMENIEGNYEMRWKSDSILARPKAGKAVAGQWVHLVGTYKASDTTRLYRDGKLAQSVSVGVLDKSSSNKIVIGRDPRIGLTRYNFNGKIADIRIFNSALSAEEVAELYKNAPQAITKDQN